MKCTAVKMASSLDAVPTNPNGS